MALDYFELKHMRKNHPAWQRLMAAENGPFIAAFMDKVFSDVKVRQISESEIRMLLEDYLFSLKETGPEESFPRSAADYLTEWSRNDRGWLRKFYPPGSDEPHFDLTPASEKALQWIRDLFERSFIGTESRLYSSIDLLRQIVHGMEEDQEVRISRLEEEKRKIEEDIRRTRDGLIPLLTDREVRERFLQFQRQSGDLLSDFRAVEQNFRDLDRETREKIASWSGDKSSLLKVLLGERDAISGSDEGQSFGAFWGFLMSSASQEELSDLLDTVCSMDALKKLDDPVRYKRIHFDWMLAGEQTQRTVARLSQQLRRFLDDKSYYENRRISQLMDNIEALALNIRKNPPEGTFMEMDAFRPDIRMPMEHPLFSPPENRELSADFEEIDVSQLDDGVLFNQVVVDKRQLKRNIHQILQKKEQVSLGAVLQEYPLKEGLAEVITYLSLGEESLDALVDGKEKERIIWTDRESRNRTALIPLVVFNRKSDGRTK